jgi:hypothetical protein
MSQYPPNPNYNPYGQNPSDPNQNPGTAYGGPPSGPGPYNPYNNPPAPDTNTNPSPYGPYGQNPPTPAPPPYNPYAQTVSNTNPNYNPYATVPPPPTILPPTQTRRGPSIRAILITVIALMLVIGGIAFGFVSYSNTQQSNANATSTAQAQANSKATATAQANQTATAQAALTATAIASTYPFSANLKLSDPLSDNSKGSGWQTDNLCKFQGNAYHVTDVQTNSFNSCSAVNTDFSNFTFEVEAVLNKGDAIGITFRGNADKNQFYRVSIYTDGSYAIYLYVDSTGTNSRKLTNGNITPTPDLTNTNVISVVASGSTFTFYFNKTKVTSFTDPTYSHGQIGVAATDLSSAADAVFTNLNVWALP